MKNSVSFISVTSVCLSLFMGCASGTENGGAGGSSTSSSTGASTSASTGSGDGGGTSSTSSTSSGTGGAGGGAPVSVSDPNVDGPYAIMELDSQTEVVPQTNNRVDIHCAYPSSGPSSGPYPVVVLAHGFQLGPDQYYGYVRRLASFGYVALTADFNAPFAGPDNTDNARELIAGLDWAQNSAELSGKVDIAATGAGAAGHSLGGKLAILAAMLDQRIKAAIVLDPVDGAPGNPLDPMPQCNPPECVDVSEELPINIPLGFIGQSNGMGESNDASCAPTAQNYMTFFARAAAPSLAVTVLGATHMSFIENNALPQCFPCALCNSRPTAEHDDVLALSRSYLVAFFERHLRNNAGYETYLTGDEAKSRYVDTGLVADPIENK